MQTIKRKLHEKAADAQQRLDYLKQDLSVIPVMEPEKLEACEHDLIDFNDQYAELRDEQNSLKQQQASLKNIVAMQNQIADQEKKLQQTKELAESEQQKLDQLATAQDALLFKDDVQVIKEKNHGNSSG